MAAEIIDVLRTFVAYNPASGTFVWLVSPHRGIKAGDPAGKARSASYPGIKIQRKSYQAHRLAWAFVHGAWPAGVIDHIDGDRNNNRIANLRDVSGGVNIQNQRRPHKTNKSGLLGVNWRADKNRWQATIRLDGRPRHLGYFATPDDAHAAYVSAKREAHPGCTI